MARLEHARSQGVIQEGTYTKTSPHNLESEAKELDRCFRLSLETPHIFPIHLISYDSEKNVLTTRFKEGNSVFNVFWNQSGLIRSLGTSKKEKDLLLSRFNELGTWLAQYHASSPVLDGPTAVIGNLSQALIAKVQDLFGRGLVSLATLQCAERYSQKISRIMRQSGCATLCTIHGDFIGYNMLWDSSQQVHILDFGDTRIGFNLEDVVRFWEQLWAIGVSSRGRATFSQSAREAFLSGYGLSEEVMAQDQCRVIRVFNAITNYLGFHFSLPYLGWRSRWINRRITFGSWTWAMREMESVTRL